MIQSGNVRTLIEEDGTILFCGKDVAEALGYTNPLKAIRDHVHDEDKTVNDLFTVNGTALILITESGLYALIFSSKLKSAQRFERWVFDGGLIKHPVRIVEKDGEPWWVAKDVCDILELGNPYTSLATLEEDDLHSVEVADSLGRKQEMSIISEPGLYSLIMRSRKPQAKAFQRWATHEVFPAIRKTGRGYRRLQNTTPTERKVNRVFTYE